MESGPPEHASSFTDSSYTTSLYLCGLQKTKKAPEGAQMVLCRHSLM